MARSSFGMPVKGRVMINGSPLDGPMTCADSRSGSDGKDAMLRQPGVAERFFGTA